MPCVICPGGWVCCGACTALGSWSLGGGRGTRRRPCNHEHRCSLVGWASTATTAQPTSTGGRRRRL
eukprot:1184532-Prorocentrum_minimum.AAC.2